MIIFKKMCPILALAAIFVFAGLASVHAGAGLEGLWPAEPNVQGSVKTKAAFTMYFSEVNTCGEFDLEVQTHFFINVRTGNSNQWEMVSGIAEWTACLQTELPKTQQAIVNFLNDIRVLKAICPQCTPGSDYVHLKRVYNGDDNYFDYEPPIAAMAELELVVNNEQPPEYWSPTLSP